MANFFYGMLNLLHSAVYLHSSFEFFVLRCYHTLYAEKHISFSESMFGSINWSDVVICKDILYNQVAGSKRS